MSEEKKSSEKSYYSKLYDVCKYLIEHVEELNEKYIEEFKAYSKENSEEISIYSFLSKNEYNEQSFYYKNKGENLSDLHNGLKAQYSFMIGKGKIKCDNISPKGSEIMPIIDEKFLDDKTVAEMLVITYQFINRHDKSTQMNRKVFSINLDKQVPMMDYLIKKILPHSIIDELKRWQYEIEKVGSVKNCPKRNEYFNLFNLVYFHEKYYINQCDGQNRKTNLYKKYLTELDFFKNKLIENGGKEFQERSYLKYPSFDKMGEIYYTWMYIDLCCKSILQYVIQGIIKNENNTDKASSIEKINNKILELIEKEKQTPQVKLEGTPEENLFKVYSYYFIRDKFLEDTKILKYITAEYENENSFNIEYSLINFDSRKKRKWCNVNDVFGEGAECEEETFKKNVANCFLLIEKFNQIPTIAPIPYTPIRLKALYKGIYVDTKSSLDKNNQKRPLKSKTIMNRFLETGEITSIDYNFINEIMNREFFREYGFLKEYNLKNQLQENLYCLSCLILARLNPLDIVNEFEVILSDITDTIGQVHNTYKKYEVWTEKFFHTPMCSTVTPTNSYEITEEKYCEIYQILECLFNIDDSEKNT